jgi:hypothetical protein
LVSVEDRGGPEDPARRVTFVATTQIGLARSSSRPMLPSRIGGSMKGTSPASENITKRIAELHDWRGATLALARKLIHEADPDVVEEWKWRGVPVWSHDGIICTGESYKAAIKLTFARGAAVKDPKKLFNASLDGNTRRAIDFHEGDEIDAAAFKQLVRAAVAANAAARAKK